MKLKVPAGATVYDGVVPFHDCDPLGIVWHGHYFKYLELGRTALMKRHRLDVPDFMQLGYKVFVTDVRCRYGFSLRYDDRYRVHAWFIDHAQRLNIGYQIDNVSQNKRAARASTTLTLTDPYDQMLWETPSEIVARIAG
jgi:acyl-CoA thioester hydrolase